MGEQDWPQDTLILTVHPLAEASHCECVGEREPGEANVEVTGVIRGTGGRRWQWLKCYSGTVRCHQDGVERKEVVVLQNESVVRPNVRFVWIWILNQGDYACWCVGVMGLRQNAVQPIDVAKEGSKSVLYCVRCPVGRRTALADSVANYASPGRWHY